MIPVKDIATATFEWLVQVFDFLSISYVLSFTFFGQKLGTLLVVNEVDAVSEAIFRYISMILVTAYLVLRVIHWYKKVKNKNGKD